MSYVNLFRQSSKFKGGRAAPT